MRQSILFFLLLACTNDDPSQGLVSIELIADGTEIDSRNPVSFSVLGDYEDGREIDLSVDAEYLSSDENILMLGLLETSLGHGIGEGIAEVAAYIGDIESNTLEISVRIDAVDVGDLIINELFADDGDADANADGSTNDEEDEFIEFVNIGFATVDLSNIHLRDSNYSEIGPRHTFAEGTHLRPGETIVVFGGGTVDSLSVEGAQFVIATNDDTGLSHGLSLNNSGEYMSLVNDEGAVLTNLAYGDEDDTGTNDAVEDASLNRSPDITGPNYTDHRMVEGSTTAYSPGTLASGEPFPDLHEWFSQLLPD